MQHSFTLDLQGLELDVPKAVESRAVAVFVDSYYELDVDSSEGVAVVWLTQEQLDAVSETPPPDDFTAERWPSLDNPDVDPWGDEPWGDDPDEDAVPRTFALELDELDDDEEVSAEDSFVGGAPAWTDAGAPAALPEGAFVLQVSSHELPFCRVDANLLIFERGGYVQASEPDDELPLPWPEAIARSRELAVLDHPPAAGSLERWGGLPRGVSVDEWPSHMSHILTWIPEAVPEDLDAVALALFGRLSRTTNWDEEATFYEVYPITQEDLDEYDAAEAAAPEGIEVLEERAIEWRPLPPESSWRDLQTLCFKGPRPAWRDPASQSAEWEPGEPVLQLTEAVLRSAPGPGTMHIVGEGYPIWHPAPGSEQATSERYQPDGTLYESDTTAALVVGYQLAFDDYSVLPERIEALERSLLRALSNRQLDLRLYVPGDTTTDRNAEVHGTMVLGLAVAIVEANDYEPGRIDPDDVRASLARIPTLDRAFWAEALADVDGLLSPDEPALYLLSWGPLCYGAIHIGVAASRDGTHVHGFVANQDMRQEWSSMGVDGVLLESVDFSDVLAIQLPEPKLDGVENPGFWLICRYD